MTDRLLVDPALTPALTAAGLASPDALFGLGGNPDATHVVAIVDLPIEGTVGRFHLKCYRYAGWGRARHLLGRGTLCGTAPEVNEFRALAWLREHGIPAVRPILAASRTRRGRLLTHALLTEHVPEAPDLATRLDTPGDPVREDPAVRARTLTRLASTLARMHAAGFAHRDVHPRNVLVHLDDRLEPRLFLLDCRRGGPASWRRGALFDLATLDADLVGRVSGPERLRALRAYLPEGTATRRTHERIAHARKRVEQRSLRRGRRRR